MAKVSGMCLPRPRYRFRAPKPSGWGTLGGVREAKPSPAAPARPVPPGKRRALLAGALGPCLAHPPAATLGALGPAPHATLTGGARLAPGAVRPGAGGGRAGCHPHQPGGRCPAQGPGIAARAQRPRHSGAWPTQRPRPRSGLRQFRGRGPVRTGTVTQPQRNRRVGTCRPGGNGRRWPRYGPAPAQRAPPPRRPPGSGLSAPALAAGESG